MALFHFAPLRLGCRSIVEPGNFGRILARYTVNGFGNPWMLAREVLFEQLRPANKPSRLASCFALPTRSDAECYRAAVDQNLTQVLHEVELISPDEPQHIGALSYLDINNGVFLEPTRLVAGHYWGGLGGDPAKGNELVTTSALRIIRVVE